MITLQPFGNKVYSLLFLAIGMAILSVFLPVGQTFGQAYNLRTEPDSFLFDLNRLGKSTRLASTEKAMSAFDAVYAAMQENQKKEFIKIAQRMGERRLAVFPHIENLVLATTFAINEKHLDQTAINQFFKTTYRVISEYDVNGINNWFNAVKLLCEKSMLASNRFGSVKTNATSIGFSFEGPQAENDTTPPPPPTNFFNEVRKPVDTSANAPEPVQDPNADKMAPPFQDPEIKGPVILLGSTDFQIENNFDTSAIEGTRAIYIVNTQTILARGGRYDWRVAGFGPEVYTEFTKYSFNPSNIDFKAEHSIMHYPDRLSRNMMGTFSFKSVKHKNPQSSNWPQFQSYLADNHLKGLPPSVTITGGFGLVGNRIHTESYSGDNTTMTIFKDGQKKLRLVGKRFDISGDTLFKTQEAASTFHLGTDTITQPGGRITFNSNTNKVVLVKDKGRFRETPFMDPYHRLEITCDEVRWPLNDDHIDFLINQASNLVPAMFQSTDYYSDQLYRLSAGILRFNPIGLVMYHYKKTGEERFFASTLAEENKLKKEEVLAGLIPIAGLAFIDLNQTTGEIILRDKIKHYYESRNKKKDYDYMSIPSISPKKVNATLDLKTNELQINGVEKFYLSDSLGVFIKPSNQEMKVLKNRDLLFDGLINAGLFTMYGHEFKFDYTKFQVDLTKIDSINLKIEAKKKKKKKKDQAEDGKPEAGEEAVKLEAKKSGTGGDSTKGAPTSGVLFINKPDNKSNAKKFPQYPILDVEKQSYVYFSHKRILNGAYNSNVYFKVPPFNADSVSSSDTRAISFDGTFTSDNIFPEFKEKLRVQKDGSLGFRHTAPQEGYKLYGGTGVFYGSISLDNRGIRGKGEIHYLTTVLKSKDFIFYQDSVITDGKTFVMTEAATPDGKYPQADCNDYHLKWKVKTDSMIVSNSEKSPINLYEKSTTLNGQLVVGKEKVNGSGSVKRQGSEVTSKNLTFEANNFSGREAFFKIESDNPEKPSVTCTNVKFIYKLKDRRAEFTPEVEGFASNEFPYARYKTSIPKAVWDFDKKIVTMSKPPETDIKDSYFYSTLPEQDSLNFSATEAVYDIEKYTLTIKGIPYILCADAKITPDSGTVKIQENANMEPLTKALIEVDTVNKYHHLIDGNIKITSRHEFNGDALYQYVNSDYDTIPIRFDAFSEVTDEKEDKKKEKDWSKYYTRSGGIVPETQPLRLTPGILFKGGVTMISRKQNLEFVGMITLDTKKNKNGNQQWITYVNKTERDFSVNTEGATDAAGQLLTSGLFYEDGNYSLYSTFISAKKSPVDKPMFQATGLLNFNPLAREFKVGPKEKIKGKTYEGNVFTYNDSTSSVAYDGAFNLLGRDTKSDRDYTIIASGSGSGISDSSNYTLDVLLQLIPALPSASWKSMELNIIDALKDKQREQAFGDRVALLYKIADVAGNRAARDYDIKTTSNYIPLAEAISKLGKGLVFSEIKMKWSKKLNAWHSVGDLGLSNINKTDINTKVKGVIELRKSQDGDIVNVFIEIGQGTWYFFNYDEQKRLHIASSDDAFNGTIAKAAKGGAKPGIFSLATAEASDKSSFLTDFYHNYTDEEYKEPEGEAKPVADTSGTGAQNPTDSAGGSTPPVASGTKKPKKAEIEKAKEPVDESADDPFPLSEEEKKKAAEEKKAKLEAERQKKLEERKQKAEAAARKKALADSLAREKANLPPDSLAKLNRADSLAKAAADSVALKAKGGGAASAEAEKKKAEEKKKLDAELKRKEDEKKKKEAEDSGGF